MDCILPGSSVHGILQGKNTEVGYDFLLQGIFPTQGSNMCLLYFLHCRQNLYWASREAHHSSSTDTQVLEILINPPKKKKKENNYIYIYTHTHTHTHTHTQIYWCIWDIQGPWDSDMRGFLQQSWSAIYTSPGIFLWTLWTWLCPCPLVSGVVPGFRTTNMRQDIIRLYPILSQERSLVSHSLSLSPPDL